MVSSTLLAIRQPRHYRIYIFFFYFAHKTKLSYNPLSADHHFYLDDIKNIKEHERGIKYIEREKNDRFTHFPVQKPKLQQSRC